MRPIPSEWLQPGAIVPVDAETVRELLECVRVAYRCGQEAERERFNALLDDYHAVLETLEEMQAAVAAEREACAKVCEERSMVKGGDVFAAKIRARGQA